MQTSHPETITARKQHVCFLCSIPIRKHTTYRRWVCFGDSVSAIKVHPDCELYAQRYLDEWTDNGVDDNAVEEDIRDRIRMWRDNTVLCVDDNETSKILVEFFGLGELVGKIVKDIQEEVTE